MDDTMKKIFNVLNCSNDQNVSFATFILEGDVKWRTTKRISKVRQESITWRIFLEKFNKLYFLDCTKD